MNEDDLAAVLQEGEILAAGLDVYVQEPIPKDHPFLPSQIWSPSHISDPQPPKPVRKWRKWHVVT